MITKQVRRHLRSTCQTLATPHRRHRLATRFLAVLLVPLTASAAAAQVRTALQVDGEAPASLLERTAGLAVRDVTLDEALMRLTEASGVIVVFSPSLLRAGAQRVTCDCERLSVGDVLDRLLAGTYFDYAVMGGQVALTPKPVTPVRTVPGSDVAPVHSASLSEGGRRARAQPQPQDPSTRPVAGAITGAVMDAATGDPLSNASVALAVTGGGAITGPDGRYTIAEVPVGTHEVRATLLGYGESVESVAVAEGETVTLDFALSVTAVQLEGIVAVGYGTRARRDVTGAITSVSSRDIASTPVTSLDQVLQGRTPGAHVVTGSGQPGTSVAVRIRGGNSITAGNDPLYVIDGVPMTTNLNEATTGNLLSQSMRGLNPLAALNPADVESIEVLKDASATAIYGARAANGVVLITTKAGRSGSNTVTFSARYGIAGVRRTLPVLGAREFAELVNEANANAGQPARFTSEEIASFDEGTDWQDAIFRTAATRSYEVSLSGGGETTRYYLSGSLLQDDGVVIGTNMDRGAFRLNLDQEISARLHVGTRLNFSRSSGQVLPNAGAGQEVPSVVLDAILAPPTLAVRTEDGELFAGDDPLSGRPFGNPVASALEITNRERQNRLIGSVSADYSIIDGLTVRSGLGVDFLNSQQDYYSPSNTLPGRNSNGVGSRGQAQTTSWLSETTVSYARPIDDIYNVDVVGGVTFQRVRSETIGGEAREFLTDRLRQNALNTAATFFNIWTGAPESSLLSYFARANVGIADKYLFTVTGRVDGSSKFGQGKQYGFFPSAALAWRISQEDFLSRLGVFDELKLRVSYGRTGNQDIGNFASLATLGSSAYPLGGTRAVGYAPATLANPDLKWETTDQLDVGLDAAFLGSRVALTADYYSKTTRDLLLQVNVPTTSGFFSSLQNIGSVRNRGFELSLSTVNLTGAFGWESSLNVAWNRNTVRDLGLDTLIIAPEGVGAGANQNPTVLKVGQPTNAFYGWKYDRIVDGQPVYQDLNGDGNVTEADRVILGSAEPDYTGGLTNRFTFRNFELSVFLQWSVGNEIYNINRALLTNSAGDRNQLEDVLDGGDGIPEPRLGNTFDTRESDLFVEDGTYLRGKNIRLGYGVPPAWLQRAAIGLRSLQVYVSAQNFFTITDYTGFDPEISEYAATNLGQGFDFGTYPQTRQLTIGFQAGF